MTRKKITADELLAHAKTNGYQRGANRDKDSLRDGNKHVDKVKLSQDLVGMFPRAATCATRHHLWTLKIRISSADGPLAKDNPSKFCRFAIMEVTKLVDAGG
jgi:hypothetical protein